ncbi:uncharacterized protein F4822DRAFT_195672 [Hypoxylon trugodes]|uniref:uncharacterized protein n=1 Tax=Hypoxylon trugodes TaxID=326681 RepID=UPI00219A99F6|nr:uncharacterized protein F4822DRAFT_195672 [Hypoxylon trugodes]KAI1389285.1 hypothetical protein F4822DRAFT_195672 [Hypoxylon trugodes]
MFPIDRSLLPSLSTRRALIVVDPQNDFLAEDGALPVKAPGDMAEQIADLATAFRQAGGDIIWVCSRFEKSRSILDEQILTSDRGPPRSPDLSRGRRRQTPPQPTQLVECPEAFLTQERLDLPKCVRPGTFGIEMHPTIKAIVSPKDYSLVKSHYSAFKSEQLLRLLRMRLVTELFICGSIANISVMATAVDAASHGYTLAIVENCCGFHNIMRYRNAIKQISNTTGCDVLNATEVLASFKPIPKPSRKSGDRPATSPAGRCSTVRRAGGEDDSVVSSTSDILSSFENLSLSAERTADPTDREPSAKDPTKPIQPVVKPIAVEDDTRKSRVKRSTSSTSDKAELVRRHEKLEQEDESQSNHLDDDNSNDAQATKRGSETITPPTAQTDGVVSQDTSKTIKSTSDEKPKESVSNEEPLKSDEEPPTKKVDPDPSPEEKSDESSGTVSETPIDKYLERTKTTLVVSQTEININSKMDPEHTTTPRKSKPLCEGDTQVIYDILPPPLSENIFERVRDEVQWQRMMHQGGEVPRLVAVQGQMDEDGTMPVYRHPSDESLPLLPFSPTVLEIKQETEKHLGHPLNHVLIQFYRDGNDYISEHSDKTLDIAKNSFIANVSLGAERTMTLRTKRQPKNTTPGVPGSSSEGPKRVVERARLSHNSLFQMGLKTNMKWLHGIRQDKRMDREKSEEELAYDGGRISLTFRQIGTFLYHDSSLIWGQGATSKTRGRAKEVINGQTSEAIEMLRGFGRENQLTEFDWDEYYGTGFDVLHISASPRLFLSADPIVNMSIQLMLAEYGVSYARGSISPLFNWQNGKPTRDPAGIPDVLPIKFVDNDLARTSVQGEFTIMIYIDHVYGKSEEGDRSQADLIKERCRQGLNLLEKHRAGLDAEALRTELDMWNTYASEGNDFIAGSAMTLVDFAFWPVLYDIVRGSPEEDEFRTKFEKLSAYYERIKARESSKKVLAASASCAPRTNKTPSISANKEHAEELSDITADVAASVSTST